MAVEQGTLKALQKVKKQEINYALVASAVNYWKDFN